MVKKTIVMLLLLQSIFYAQEKKTLNIYEQNCLPCHKALSTGINKIFFRYLLKYSSEEPIKSALIKFLKHPSLSTSAMSEDQIRRFGIKSKTHLNDKEIKEAIDIYWEKYKVFGKLY